MFTVVIENTGQTYMCPTDRSLLHGMEQLACRGIPVGCRGGGCGICRVRIVDGRFSSQKMSRAQVSEEDVRGGIVLACRTTPLSDIKLQTLGLKTASSPTNSSTHKGD